jgi:hypothetical protein
MHVIVGLKSQKSFGGNMQDLINRLQSAKNLTQQLLERL